MVEISTIGGWLLVGIWSWAAHKYPWIQPNGHFSKKDLQDPVGLEQGPKYPVNKALVFLANIAFGNGLDPNVTLLVKFLWAIGWRLKSFLPGSLPHG